MAACGYPHINMGRAARVAALETKLLTTSQGVGVTAAIFALKNADPDECGVRSRRITSMLPSSCI
jgi:hypothetical protein